MISVPWGGGGEQKGRGWCGIYCQTSYYTNEPLQVDVFTVSPPPPPLLQPVL